jgi:glyoxylase-like metal-dependent hydrolase (beta-lactamase superfamily II)
MKPVEVSPQVWCADVSGGNIVLIGEGQDVVLVDAGYPKDRELVKDLVTEVGRTVGDIAGVLLTHAHADHIGCAEWLRRQHGIPVYCHAGEAAHVRGEVREAYDPRDALGRLWRPGVLRPIVTHMLRGGRNPERVDQVSTFTDGEILDVPGRPLAIFTPGHTSGHAGFYLPNRGVLISGDALITVDVFDSSHRGPQMIRPAFNHDHARAIDSLWRFEGLQADVMIPGHGLPYRGTPAQAVAAARAGRWMSTRHVVPRSLGY